MCEIFGIECARNILIDEIIDVVEGTLISFPSLMRYSIRNDKVTGYDVTFNN